NVQLQLSVSSVQTEVTVTGVAGEVRADMPQLGDRIGPEQAQELPLLNSRITYLPLVNAANRPAINQGDVFMNEDLMSRMAPDAGKLRLSWMAQQETIAGDGRPSSAIFRGSRCRR